MTVLVVLFCLMNVAAMVMVFLNRASEKVVTSYLSISLGFVAGLALAIAAFADQGKMDERFPISFFVDRRDGHLVNISTRSVLFFDLGLSAWNHASSFLDSKNTLDLKPYHLALQRTLIEWMNHVYWRTWRVESVRYESTEFWRFGPIPGANEASTVLNVGDLSRMFPNGSPPVAEFENIKTISLPPGLLNRRAKLDCKEPRHDPAKGDVAEISISNDYCELTIKTLSMGETTGFGEYGVMAAIPEEESRNYMRLDFDAFVTVRFSPYLGGHPQMSKQKQWATSFIEMMRDQFDEQRILARSRDAIAHPKGLPPILPHLPAITKYSDVKTVKVPPPVSNTSPLTGSPRPNP